MNVIKLNESYIDDIKHLFIKSEFMGTQTDNNYFVDKELKFDEFYHRTFTETYMSGLLNYHSFGVQENDGKIIAIIGFYESIDDASWYWVHLRTTGNDKKAIRLLIDKTIEWNEQRGRFKFYSMFPKKYTDAYDRLLYSKFNAERYGYFDEYFVKAKHQCKFTLAWQILYNRTLIPVDTVVRCRFLKQQYRNSLFDAGGL